uniref:Uncharacterized protein n=1 Tax=Rhizophora mucronata TaxID=61149 RepID=A0A2P2JE38_RHIMU
MLPSIRQMGRFSTSPLKIQKTAESELQDLHQNFNLGLAASKMNLRSHNLENLFIIHS